MEADLVLLRESQVLLSEASSRANIASWGRYRQRGSSAQGQIIEVTNEQKQHLRNWELKLRPMREVEKVMKVMEGGESLVRANFFGHDLLQKVTG